MKKEPFGGRLGVFASLGGKRARPSAAECREQGRFPCGRLAVTLRGWGGPSTSTQTRVLLSGMTTY